MRLVLLPLLAALLLFTAPAKAQAHSAPQISLLTFQPGSVYWQRFGHNAIVVRENGRATAYNYGIFDFAQKNFMLNFVRGLMQYRVEAQPLAQALYPYHLEGRWALEQQLALNPEQAHALAEFLQWNARPENAEYRYDYFIANCSTKVRDALNETLSGRLQQQLTARPARLNYREQVARVSSPEPWLMLGMDVGLGPAADQTINLWQESFIPGVLMRALRDVKRADGTPLVSNERYLLRATQDNTPEQAPTLWPWFLAAGLILGILLLLLGQLRQHLPARALLGVFATLYMLVCAVGGIFLALVWAFTLHWGTYANQNMLMLNPLCLLLLPLWLTQLRKTWQASVFSLWVTRLVLAASALALILHFIPGLAQANGHWVALLLPIHAALAWVAERSADT